MTKANTIFNPNYKARALLDSNIKASYFIEVVEKLGYKCAVGINNSLQNKGVIVIFEANINDIDVIWEIFKEEYSRFTGYTLPLRNNHLL
jgi:hypothetical protein